MLLDDLAHDTAQIVLCLFHSHPAAQPRNPLQSVVRARAVLQIQLQRHPQFSHIRKVKTAWHNPYHPRLIRPDADRLPHDPRVPAVPTPPQVLAQ